jgi:hypothetical protein
VVHADNKSSAEMLARKTALTDEKKKLAINNQQLNLDKKKLAQSQALLQKQQQAYLQSVKSSQLTTTP